MKIDLIHPITNVKIDLKDIDFFHEIPDLFIPELGDEIVLKQSDFYNDIKFPNYDNLDDFGSLIEKSKKSIFFNKLDEEIPYYSKVLEAGCGTGQLSIALSRYGRKIFGIDISKGSLIEGRKFIQKNYIKNVSLFRMNILNIFFPKNYFDIIISNGVLHHTRDTEIAFHKLVKHLKPGGLIVVGLYHKYGRLIQNMRQILIKLFGKKISYYLDKRFSKNISEKKKYAWLKDQYQNPHEKKHTFFEVLKWFNSNNIEFLNSVPFHFKPDSKIFSKQITKNKNSLLFKELFLFNDPMQVYEGGFFIMIGKKIK